MAALAEQEKRHRTESEEKSRNIHKEHRKRRKQQFREHGIEPFSEHGALELLLYYAIPQKDTNPLAHELIDRFGSLHGVLTAPVEELVKVPGVQEHTAILLTLVPQVYRKSRLSLAKNHVILDTTQRQGEYFKDLLSTQTNESMYQLCLDAKGRMLRVYKVGEGDVSSVGLNVRRIVENALRCNATMVVIAHNHPSGFAYPSPEDRAATVQIQEALETVNVYLMDHIIVADDDFVSLRQSGYL